MMTLVPQRIRDFEMNGEKAVVLLPRFSSGWAARHIQPRLKKPYMKVSLDDIGTLIWSLVDGKRTVFDIMKVVEEQFKERIDPAPERMGVFITMMKNHGMIELKDPEDA